MYGYLPAVFTELKTFVLTEPVSSGTPTTLTLATSAESVNFLDALALFNTQINTQSGGDITATFSTGTGRVSIVSASSATWEITAWKARGFFGFDYPINNSNMLSGPPMGAQMLEGLSVDQVRTVSTTEGREDYGDSYQQHRGTALSLSGYIRPDEMRPNHRSGEGSGSELGWSSYKGRVRIVDLAGDAGAWSVTNPTGYIDGRTVSASVSGNFGVLGAELWAASLVVQI